MKKAVRYISWAAALWLCLAWLLHADELPEFQFQKGRTFRNVTGIIVLGMLFFQWGLTLGRTVFQRSGSEWSQWVNWHLRIALVLPFAVIGHSIQLGWGILALLPLTLLASSHFGTLLEGNQKTQQYLIYHIILSALTMAMALVHAYTVVFYN